VREVDMTPHVAPNDPRRGGSAIDARTTRHAGYAMSQHAAPHRARFAWLKTIAGLRKVKLRGLATVDTLFVFASAAFNIKRIVTLRAAAARDATPGRLATVSACLAAQRDADRPASPRFARMRDPDSAHSHPFFSDFLEPTRDARVIGLRRVRRSRKVRFQLMGAERLSGHRCHGRDSSAV
jgi:hypothetical protein